MELLFRKRKITNLSGRLIKGASWALLGSIMGKGIIMISYIWVARLLSQNVYGEFGILRSTINMFTVFAGMGLGTTASKYISQYRNVNPDKAGNIYMLSNLLIYFIASIFALSLFVTSSYIAEYSLEAPNLSDEIKVGSIVLFFITINSVQNGALAGFEDFKSISINNFVSSCIQSICIIIGCYWNGILGILIGWGVGSFSCYFFNRRSINRQLFKYNISYSKYKIPKEELSVLWKFSVPTLLASIMVAPILWWTKTYLVSQADYEEMAVFDVVEQWYTMVLYIPIALSQIILPILTNIMEEGTIYQYVKVIKANLAINVCISLLLSLGVIIIGPYIMGIYGEGFIDIKALTIMMLTTIASSACNVVGQVIASRDKMWHGLCFNLVWAILVISFTILFVGKCEMGASGLALAILLSYSLHFIFQTSYIWKIVHNSLR